MGIKHPQNHRVFFPSKWQKTTTTRAVFNILHEFWWKQKLNAELMADILCTMHRETLQLTRVSGEAHYSTPVSCSRKRHNFPSTFTSVPRRKQAEQSDSGCQSPKKQGLYLNQQLQVPVIEEMHLAVPALGHLQRQQHSPVRKGRIPEFLAHTRARGAWGQGQWEASVWFWWVRELSPYPSWESFSKDSTWGAASALSVPVNFKLELRVLSSIQDQIKKPHRWCEN